MTGRHVLGLALLTLAAGCPHQGAAPPAREAVVMPKLAYGLSTEPMPAGAVPSKLSPAEIEKLAAAGKLKPVVRELPNGAFDARAKISRQLREEVARAYAGRPEVLAKLMPGGPARALAGPEGGAGNYAIEITQSDGSRETVATLGHDELMRELLAFQRALAQPGQQKKLEKALRDQLQQRGVDLGPARSPQPTGDRLPRSPAADTAVGRPQRPELALGELARRVDDRPFATALIGQPEPPPPGYVSDCSAEEGAGTVTATSGDRTEGCKSPKANPSGLLTAWWPLKWFNTCVKSQGRRGTCPAFGVTAAVESRIALAHRRWVNLSEQDLYKHFKLDWTPSDPTLRYCLDGYDPPLGLLEQMGTSYVYPWERDWNYNPSRSRSEPCVEPGMWTDRECWRNIPGCFTRSCDGYTDTAVGCSETVHQASFQCEDVVDPVTVCSQGHVECTRSCAERECLELSSHAPEVTCSECVDKDVPAPTPANPLATTHVRVCNPLSCSASSGVSVSCSDCPVDGLCRPDSCHASQDVVECARRGDACVSWGACMDEPRWVCDAEGTIDAHVRQCFYGTEVPGTSGVSVAAFAPLAGPMPSQAEMALAKVALALRNPIVLSLIATPSFGSTDGGFVRFDPAEMPADAALRGHVVLLTGFVDNDRLPSGAPAGAGGGYFIVKNSWGRCSGDMGYHYLPYAWVHEWATGMIVLFDVHGPA